MPYCECNNAIFGGFFLLVFVAFLFRKGNAVPSQAVKVCWEYTGSYFDLDSERRWMVSLTPRPLYEWRKKRGYIFDRKLVGSEVPS